MRWPSWLATSKEKFLLRPKRNALVLVAVIALVSVLLGFFRGQNVDYMVIEKNDAVETVLANGLVAGDSVVPLAMENGGRVLRWEVAPGQLVRQGEPLLMLDAERQQAALDGLKAAYEASIASREALQQGDIPASAARYQQAAAEAAYMEENLKRQELLFAAGGISEMALLAARRDAQVATAKAEGARQELQALKDGRLRLAYAQEAQALAAYEASQKSFAEMVLTAPMEGRIVETNVKPGELVAPGQNVAQFLPKISQQHVELAVDEAEIGRILVGQESFVTVAARPDQPIPARVFSVGSLIDKQTGTFIVTLKITEPDVSLTADMSASAQIILQEYREVITLPATWTINRDDGLYVLMASRGKASLKKVEGKWIGDGHYLIEDGLQAGDKILSPLGLEPGEKIRLSRQVENV